MGGLIWNRVHGEQLVHRPLVLLLLARQLGLLRLRLRFDLGRQIACIFHWIFLHPSLLSIRAG